jgi:hypothetical protein
MVRPDHVSILPPVRSVANRMLRPYSKYRRPELSAHRRDQSSFSVDGPSPHSGLGIVMTTAVSSI